MKLMQRTNSEEVPKEAVAASEMKKMKCSLDSGFGLVVPRQRKDSIFRNPNLQIMELTQEAEPRMLQVLTRDPLQKTMINFLAPDFRQLRYLDKSSRIVLKFNECSKRESRGY